MSSQLTPIINNLLTQPQIATLLEGYIYVAINDLNNIPLGSHIKFIDRNENVKSGGFLIKLSIKSDRTKSYIILKSNLMYKIFVYYYWIFYKPITQKSTILKFTQENIPELIDNQNINPTTNKMDIIIKPKTKPKTKSNTKPKTKADIFSQLLESLDKK